jgi:hypothetical protein
MTALTALVDDDEWTLAIWPSARTAKVSVFLKPRVYMLWPVHACTFKKASRCSEPCGGAILGPSLQRAFAFRGTAALGPYKGLFDEQGEKETLTGTLGIESWS